MEPLPAQQMRQDTQLKTPLSDPPAPSVLPAAAPDPEAPAETKFDWFWCASCYIVTERSGDCPSCSRQVIAVTGDALPYGPYLPQSTRARRRRLHAAPVVAVSLVAIAAIMGGLLYRAGAPIGGAAGGSGGASSSTVHTPVTVPVLGPLALPGQFTADASVATGLKQNFGPDHGTVSLAVSDGTTSFGIIMLPPAAAATTQKPGTSPTPAPVQLNVGDTQTNSDGSKSTVTDKTLLIIDGFQAIRQDVTITVPATGARVTQRRYFIGVPSGRVVINIETTATPSPLGAIETALLAYPGSTGPL